MFLLQDYKQYPGESIGLKFIPSQSELFRYLYPSQRKSFRTNPKNGLYFVEWKTVKNQTDSIRINPGLGFIRIDFDWKFDLDQSERGLVRIENLVRIHLD